MAEAALPLCLPFPVKAVRPWYNHGLKCSRSEMSLNAEQKLPFVFPPWEHAGEWPLQWNCPNYLCRTIAEAMRRSTETQAGQFITAHWNIAFGLELNLPYIQEMKCSNYRSHLRLQSPGSNSQILHHFILAMSTWRQNIWLKIEKCHLFFNWWLTEYSTFRCFIVVKYT